MTARGRLCKNFRMPSTNSCFDSNSAKVPFISYSRLHKKKTLKLTCKRNEVVKVDDGKERLAQLT